MTVEQVASHGSLNHCEKASRCAASGHGVSAHGTLQTDWQQQQRQQQQQQQQQQRKQHKQQ